MFDQSTIRNAVLKAIDSNQYSDDGIYANRNEVVSLFDELGVTRLDQMPIFFEELEARFPDVDWTMLDVSFDLFIGEHLAKMPRQTLPAVQLSIFKNDVPLKPGLTRIGGEPKWLQAPSPGEEYPFCSDCSEVMAFVCQIDSLGVNNKGMQVDEYSFVDAGCFYLFACIHCGQTDSTFQCY